VGSKIAAGMEAAHRITFAPESIDSCEQQLVVVTEREKFLVPLLAVGAAAALDLPDSLTLPAVAAKKSSRRSLLVTNIGRKAGSFQLACSSACFSVSPARATLAPGETMQLTVDLTPPAPGEHEGELEVVYEDSSRTTFTVLRGQGLQLEVGLSDSQVVFLPTCMGKLSQRSFKVVNRSSSTVAFSLRSQPSPEAEIAAACTALAAVQQQGASLSGTGIATVRGLSGGGAGSHSRSGRRAGSSNGSSCQQQQQQRQIAAGMDVEMELVDESSWSQAAGQQQQQQQRQQRCSTSSSEGASEADWLVGDAQLAALRKSKRARLDIAADKQLFGTQHFAAFPPEGCVYPNSEQEVVLQFAPDCAEQFDAVAWMELEGLGERLPLQLLGQGVGAQVVFSYENVDIGEVFVNTEHCYEVELLNRGKVDTEWMLQPCHTRFGSKFSFSPSSGLLQPGAGQVIAVRLLSDILGQFEESFQLFLTGSSRPVPLVFRGAVVGPQFTLDTQALDYGIMSYGFRWVELAGSPALDCIFSDMNVEDRLFATSARTAPI
jgi:hydrocephalus-inducing protein